MPIKDKTKYPGFWKQLSDYIRFIRAGGRCECTGECGLHTTTGRCVERHNEKAKFAKGKVILTVAHLNHIESDCDPKNLKTMCQRCHLRYDTEHHKINSMKTRRKKKAINDLFE